MNVISYKRIREFASSYRDAAESLRAWYTTAKKSHWQNLAELKQVYPSADMVSRYTVFNIRGNKYRLLTAITYPALVVNVLQFLTHAEYDKEKWKKTL